MAADAGEADAIATLTGTRGILGAQHLQPGMPPAGPAGGQLPPPAGFGLPFSSGPGIPLVRSEPVGAWSQRDAAPLFGQAAASDPMLGGLRVQPSLPQMLPDFDLSGGMGDFDGGGLDPRLALDGLDSPAVPSF